MTKKRLLNTIGGIVALLVLVALAVILALTLSQQTTSPEPMTTLAAWQRVTSTPESETIVSPLPALTEDRKTPSPTGTATPGAAFDSPIKTPTSPIPPVPWPTASPYTPPPGWEHVTLEQIHFSEPKVVLAHTGRIKVIEWLPDSQRLLLELGTDDPVLHNRIVTLNVETREIVEYGRRPDRDIAPVWVEQAQGMVFNFLIQDTPAELRFGQARGQVFTLDQADAYPTVHRPSGRVLYLPVGAGLRTDLRVMDITNRSAAPSPFEALVPTEKAGFKKLQADPQGRWLVSYWGLDGLQLADIGRGIVRQIDLVDPSQPSVEWWPSDAVWSPNGQRTALILAWRNDLLLKSSKLAILEPESGDWHWLDLPSQFIDEIDWAPDGRHLLVLGADLEEGEHINTFWLVDIVSGEYLHSDLLTQRTMLVPQWSVAWSENGQRLARFGGVPGGGIGILLSDVEIVR